MFHRNGQPGDILGNSYTKFNRGARHKISKRWRELLLQALVKPGYRFALDSSCERG